MSVNQTLELTLDQFERERSALIPVLQFVQTQAGYVSKDAVAAISNRLRVPTSEIFGVLTFYAQFRLKPMGKHNIKVCRGTACHVRGAPFIINAVEDELKLTDTTEDTTPDGEFTVEKIACFGACSLAPVMVLDGDTSGHMSPDRARRLIRRIQKPKLPAPKGEANE
jgi:NADH-quinone oxidoreductase subunit E